MWIGDNALFAAVKVGNWLLFCLFVGAKGWTSLCTCDCLHLYHARLENESMFVQQTRLSNELGFVAFQSAKAS